MILCNNIFTEEITESLQRILVVSEVAMYVILLSLISAGLGLFLQECYQKNMILRKYYVYLNYLFIKNRRSSWQRKKKAKKVVSILIRKLTMLAGLCIFCQSTWICIGFCFWGYELKLAPETNPFFILASSIGMTYLFVVRLKKHLNI